MGPASRRIGIHSGMGSPRGKLYELVETISRQLRAMNRLTESWPVLASPNCKTKQMELMLDFMPCAAPVDYPPVAPAVTWTDVALGVDRVRTGCVRQQPRVPEGILRVESPGDRISACAFDGVRARMAAHIGQRQGRSTTGPLGLRGPLRAPLIVPSCGGVLRK